MWVGKSFRGPHKQRNLFGILLYQPKIRLYLPCADWFGTKRSPSIWFQINRFMVNTIWFQYDLIRFLCLQDWTSMLSMVWCVETVHRNNKKKEYKALLNKIVLIVVYIAPLSLFNKLSIYCQARLSISTQLHYNRKRGFQKYRNQSDNRYRGFL